MENNVTTPEQDEQAEEAGLAAQVAFWRNVVTEQDIKIGQLLADRTMPAPPNLVVETDKLVDHIEYLETELDVQKQRVERMVAHIVEHKASRDRLLKRLLEVVAERDELRRRK
jgi:uncharacterized coiled-coil DUF342 family protein